MEEINHLYALPQHEDTIETEAFDEESTNNGKKMQSFEVEEDKSSTTFKTLATVLAWIIRLISIVVIIAGPIKFVVLLQESYNIGEQGITITGPNVDIHLDIKKDQFVLGRMFSSTHGILDVMFGIFSWYYTRKHCKNTAFRYLIFVIAFMVIYIVVYVLEFMIYAKENGVEIGHWIEGAKREAGTYTLKRDFSDKIFTFTYSGKDYELIDYEEKDYFISFIFDTILEDFNFKQSFRYYLCYSLTYTGLAAAYYICNRKANITD